MKITKINNDRMRYIYWLVNLTIVGILALIGYLSFIFAPVAYNKAKKMVEPKKHQGVIIIEDMDRHCPITKGIVTHMYFYDHEKGKKIPLIVGSKRAVKEALAVVKDKKEIKTHICFYN